MELIFLLFIPAIASILSLVPVKNRDYPALVTVIGSLLDVVITLHLALIAYYRGGGEIVAINHLISTDAFGIIIVVLTAFVGFTASIFSWGYMKKVTEADNYSKVRRYYARYNLFMLSMFAVPIFSQIAVMWIAVELTTILSVFLVSFRNTKEALEAAWKYAILTSMGAAFALFGILILYWSMKLAGGDYFTWNGLKQISTSIPSYAAMTSFVFILIGFGAKAGLVPLHVWLPDAHSQAPSPVSALLSPLKCSTVIIYVLLRFLPIFSGDSSLYAGNWYEVIGLLSMGVSAFLILQVKDYKRLFAFSTIEQMGIILTAAGLLANGAHYGALYQMFSQAVTKSFCFFAAGTVLTITQTQQIESIKGLVRISPIAGIALIISGFAIAGAPPFAVFLGEITILKSGVAAGQYLVTGLMAFFIIISFIGIMYNINRMAFGKPSERYTSTKQLPVSYSMALGIAVIPVILFGLYVPVPISEFINLAVSSWWR
jgi:hydrogenase-4 component F